MLQYVGILTLYQLMKYMLFNCKFQFSLWVLKCCYCIFTVKFWQPRCHFYCKFQFFFYTTGKSHSTHPGNRCQADVMESSGIQSHFPPSGVQISTTSHGGELGAGHCPPPWRTTEDSNIQLRVLETIIWQSHLMAE